MSNKVIVKKQPILFNSIDEQRLSYANQLTVKSWNDIINILRVQTNTNTAYIKQLHNWLVGNTGEDITIPETATSFVEYVLSGAQSFDQLDVNSINAKNVNVTGSIKHSSELILNADRGVIRFGDITGNGALAVLAGSGPNYYLRPGISDKFDLGDPDEYWKDLYISGKLTDGTHNVPIRDIVTTTTDQTITGAKRFAGIVGNIQTESGVYLGIDENVGAPNANIAITSANTAAYIDMGPPNKDYGFRLIKWNNLNGKYNAELCYGDDGSGQGMATITIPRVSGTMALTSDIPPIDNASGVQDIGWTHADMDTPRIATANRIAHWNGAYNNTNASNLKYGVGGELAFKSDIDNVIQVASGKTKTYVIDVADNPKFNSDYNYISLTKNDTLITIDGVVVDLDILQKGDNILVINTTIPDRYFGGIHVSDQPQIIPDSYRFYMLETRKIDLDVKQDTLVSGENIKTIDGKSLLGNGDITTYNLIYSNAGPTETVQDVITQIKKYLNVDGNEGFYRYNGHIRYTGYKEYLNGYINLQVYNNNTHISISYADVLNMTYCKASGEYSVIANLGLQEFLDTYTKKYNATIQHITKPDNKEGSSNSTYTVKQLYDEVKKTGVNMEWFRLTINFAPPHDAQGWCSLKSPVEGTYIITFTDYASNKRYAVTADDTFRLIDLCQYPYETPIPYLNAKEIYKDGYSVVTSEDLQNLKNEIKGYRASGRGSINQSDNPYVLLGVVLNKDEILKDYSQNSEIPIFKPLYLFGNNIYDYWIILNFTYTDNLINFTAMKINEGSRPRIVEGINVPDTITQYYDVTEDMYKEYTWATSEELENYLPLTGGTVTGNIKAQEFTLPNGALISSYSGQNYKDIRILAIGPDDDTIKSGTIHMGTTLPKLGENSWSSTFTFDMANNALYSSAGNSLSLGLSDKQWWKVYGKQIYQDGKQVANKEDIPTKTSELTNDSNFLTEHQDISGKADKTELDNYIPYTTGTADNAKNIHWTTRLNDFQFDIESTKPSIKFDGDRVGYATITPNKIELNGIEGGPASILLDGKPVALQENIPTKLSQLEEDVELGISEDRVIEIVKENKVTKTSELTNDSGFITNAVNNLTNYYLKSETYTKSEVQQLLSTISSLKLEVVTNLPTTDISSNTIYLKLLDSAKENNIYEEYIYINDKWETIGTTAVDLSNYALTSDIPTKTSQLTNDSSYTTKADLDAKQNKLKSGTNIKTINGDTILGSGNINTMENAVKYQPIDKYFTYSIIDTRTNMTSSSAKFTKDSYDNFYRTISTGLIKNSYLICRIQVTSSTSNEVPLTIEYNHMPYSDKTYAVFGQLDATLSDSTDTSEDAIYLNLKNTVAGKGVFSQNIAEKVMYNIPRGTHFFEIKCVNTASGFVSTPIEFKINDRDIYTIGDGVDNIQVPVDTIHFDKHIVYDVVNCGSNIDTSSVDRSYCGIAKTSNTDNEYELPWRTYTFKPNEYILCKINIKNISHSTTPFNLEIYSYYEAPEDFMLILSSINSPLIADSNIDENAQYIIRGGYIRENIKYLIDPNGGSYQTLYIKILNKSTEDVPYRTYIDIEDTVSSSVITDGKHTYDLDSYKYSLEEIYYDLNNKQYKLTPGKNITITGNRISANDTKIEFKKVDNLPELTPELAKEPIVYSYQGNLYKGVHALSGYAEPLYLKEVKTDMLPHKINGMSTAYVNGKIYMFGGYAYYTEDGGYTITDKVVVYDILDDSIEVLDVGTPCEIEDIPVAVVGTDIYIIYSLYDYTEATGVIYKFDTINNTFETLYVDGGLNAIDPKSINQATTVDNLIYIVDSQGYVWVFDPSVPTIYQVNGGLSTTNDADVGGCLVKAVGRNIYIIGGFCTNTISKYCIDDDNHKILSDTFINHEVLYDTAGDVIGTDIYIFGGEYNEIIYKLDTTTDKLTELDIVLPTYQNKDGCAISVNDHEIYLLGGDIGDDEKTADVVVFSLTHSGDEDILEYQQLTSGGASKPLKVYVEEGTTEQHIEPNKYYIFSAQVAPELTLTFAEESEEYLDEFMGEIQVDEDPIVINVPSGIHWKLPSEVTLTDTQLILSNKFKYLFSIVNNVGLISSIENPALLTNNSLSYSESSGIVSWSAVENADYYSIWVSVGISSTVSYEKIATTTETSVNLNTLEYFKDFIAGLYYIQIRASSNKYSDAVLQNLMGGTTVSYKKTYQLATPTNLILSDTNQLSWDSVEYATSYQVTLVETGANIKVTTNLCDLVSSFSDLATAGTYTFNVKSIGSNSAYYLTSEPSENVTVTIASEV